VENEAQRSHKVRNSIILAVLFVILFGVIASFQIRSQDVVASCVLGEVHLRSQGDEATIGGGGDVEDELANMDNNGILPTNFVADNFINVTGASPMVQSASPAYSNVLILVIDDFVNKLSKDSDRSHGDYVMEVATVTYHELYDGQQVSMFPVNYGPVQTLDSALQHTASVFNTLAQDNSYDLVILNMSWIILPCEGDADGININVFGFNEVISSLNDERYEEYDLNGDGLISFVEYTIVSNDLDGLNDYYTASEAIADFILDPNNAAEEVNFYDVLGGEYGYADDGQEPGDISFDVDILPVAAAGNFSTQEEALPPFAPASWENVLAVSGSPVNDFSNRWNRSHNGQVMAPASWHPTMTDEYVQGTSFSTPMVSVFAGFMVIQSDCNLDALFPNNIVGANTPFASAINSVCQSSSP